MRGYIRCPRHQGCALLYCTMHIASAVGKIRTGCQKGKPQGKDCSIAMTSCTDLICRLADLWPRPMMMELLNIAAYAYQDVHVWSAL